MKWMMWMTAAWPLLLFNSNVKAQSRDSLRIGKLTGIAFDSSHNHVLKNASIAIYNSEKELITFSLSNHLGEFSFRQLPLDKSIRLVISYVGYQPFVKDILLTRKKDSIALHYINMQPGNNDLHEIVVTGTPPVRMNGDTLEFNADAFHLEKHAVTEDLLKRLPGVTLWGDGMITVNGRPVSRVLVDGKPFFGGSTVIATQNIPKEAIDKIQVYQYNKDANRPNPFDSATDMNIKLKDNMKAGRFGKMAAGVGTRNTHEGDLSINFFTPATELGIVGAVNNTNKTAGSIGQLMQNSTFKGGNANIDYQSDFNKSGVNKAIVSGLTYNHTYTHKDHYTPQMVLDNIGGNYFFTDNRAKNVSDNTTQMTLGADSTLTLQSNVTSDSRQVTHHLALKPLNFHNGTKTILTLTPNVLFSQYDNNYHTVTSGVSGKHQVQSTSDVTSATHTNTQRYDMDSRFTRRWKNFTELGIYHAINYQHNDHHLSSLSIFAAEKDPSANQYIDRRSSDVSSGLQQRLSVSWNGISRLIFGYGKFMSTVNIDLDNTIHQTVQSNDSRVNDRDTLSKTFQENSYLTYNNRLNIVDENPGIRLNKSFTKTLADRYSKGWNITIHLNQQFYIQQNSSSHAFQRYKRVYSNFVPLLDINYSNDQFGRYRNTVSTSFRRSYEYATTAMLYPIVDSSLFYYRTEGNPFLQPAGNNTWTLKYDHNSKKINYTFSVTGTVIDHYLGNSSSINESGVTINKTINVNGRSRFEVNGEVKKDFRLSQLSQLQITDKADYNNDRLPNYLNNVLNVSTSHLFSNNIMLYFSHRDKLAVNLSQNISHYYSIQQGLNDVRIKTLSLHTQLSAGYYPTGRWHLSSNITSNRFSSSAASAVSFTIWNASTSYRFMKERNLELKLSALDILAQNKSVANYSNSYTVTQEVRNVLQQYFMVTVSYFPRKFGK